jgi:tRNA(adenine34) deaminase
MDTASQESLDKRYMQMAINQAAIAEENGDVPIGVVIVHENRIIAKAYNERQQLNDPTASEAVGSWRLHGCTIYVTLEPCPMCAGALVLARIDRLVFGTEDPKTGACGSLYNIVQDLRLNHQVQITSGVLMEDCKAQLQAFFQRRRQENRSEQ